MPIVAPPDPCSRSRFWRHVAGVWSARNDQGAAAGALGRDTQSVKREGPIPALKRPVADLVAARVRGWSQAHAAYFLGTHQARVSDVRHGRRDRFSLEQLIRFASRADDNVMIRVEWATDAILFR